MNSRWKPLCGGIEKSKVPPLLIKYEIGLSNYKIWLTDLTYIWSETLDRRQIIQRAFKIDTGIDPSEDSGQFRLFLQSVGDALSQKSGTNVAIVPSDNEKEVELRTCTPLPGNLRPLEWHVHLLPEAEFAVTREIVLPLLSQQLAAQTEKTSLIQQIRNRDNGIGKLIEKMQSDGSDLSNVFPGAVSSKTGRLSNARQVIGASVKGLAEFNAEEWQSRSRKDNVVPEKLETFLAKVFAGDVAEQLEQIQTPDMLDFGAWWTRLRSHEPLSCLTKRNDTTLDTEADTAVDNDFQTQPTPPKFDEKLGSSNTASRNAGDEGIALPIQTGSTSRSTTDESEIDTQAPKIKDQYLNTKRTESNQSLLPQIGAVEISGATYRERTVPMIATSSKSCSKPSSSDEDPMDLDSGVAAPGKDMYESSKAASKPQSRLGQIGGKKSIAGNKAQEAPSLASKPSKLGMIGGVGDKAPIRSRKIQDDQHTAEESRKLRQNTKQTSGTNIENSPKKNVMDLHRLNGVATVTKTSLPPQETEEERANKKREQLKRDLEIKAQAGKKKKRKF